MSKQTKIVWLVLLIAGLCILKVYSEDTILPPDTEPTYHPYYFVATAFSADNLESDYSEELKLSPTNYIETVTLAWDRVTNAVSYTVYYGRASNVYTNSIDAHNTNLITIRLRSAPKTNCIVNVTTARATNLACAIKLNGSWTMLNRTNFTEINTQYRFWKVFGVNSKIYINKQYDN